MRKLGVAVVLFGMVALGLIVIDAIQRSVPGWPEQVTASENIVAVSRLVFWAAFVGVVALATLTRGIGDVVMSRRDQKPADPPCSPNGETAAMIDAEVNEGGRPSPVPCDTPFEHTAREEKPTVMSEEPPMLEACPAPDRVLHLPIGETVGATTSATLMKSAGLELIRLVIPAGKEIPPHRAPGEITVQCIEGHVAFEHDGNTSDLHTGDLVYLCPQEIHALKGIVDSSVLVTRLHPRADEVPEKCPAP